MSGGTRDMKIIARVCSEFPEKFGIPRQSGMVEQLRAKVVFEPEFRVWEAFRGLEEFSHIWLVWEFSEAVRDKWSPTVRPPRLGGNRRVGVFATRSPFRPNPIGLSCVRLEKLEQDPALGPVLHILGADLMDGTPVYDVKPYLPLSDCRPEAAGGFSDLHREDRLEVEIPPELRDRAGDRLEALAAVLALDPRPSYQDDPDRMYGMTFAGLEVRFTVSGGTLFVKEIGEGKQPAPQAGR